MKEETYPFTSDGCSGFMSFFWNILLKRCPPWEEACIQHDYKYWQGGDLFLRKMADEEVMKAVISTGHPHIAYIMYLAVRIGGIYWIPFPSLRQVAGKWILEWNGVRWGYKYKYPRYK